MWQYPGILAMAAVVGINFFASTESAGQTPAEAEQWEQQRAQARADEQARTAQLSREREARRADPMAWVRTLDPMLAGGWEFRAVAADGSWATYSTNHQMKRAGSQVTVLSFRPYLRSLTSCVYLPAACPHCHFLRPRPPAALPVRWCSSHSAGAAWNITCWR